MLKKKMKQRIGAVALSLCMAVSLIPFPVSAASGGSGTSVEMRVMFDDDTEHQVVFETEQPVAGLVDDECGVKLGQGSAALYYIVEIRASEDLSECSGKISLPLPDGCQIRDVEYENSAGNVTTVSDWTESDGSVSLPVTLSGWGGTIYANITVNLVPDETGGGMSTGGGTTPDPQPGTSTDDGKQGGEGGTVVIGGDTDTGEGATPETKTDDEGGKTVIDDSYQWSPLYFNNLGVEGSDNVIYINENSNIEGISYEAATQTLTFNNFKQGKYFLQVHPLSGKLTIKAEGSNQIAGINVLMVQGESSIEFTGSGSLTIDPSEIGELGDSAISFPSHMEMNNTSIHVTNGVTLTLKSGIYSILSLSGTLNDQEHALVFDGIVSGDYEIQPEAMTGMASELPLVKSSAGDSYYAAEQVWIDYDYSDGSSETKGSETLAVGGGAVSYTNKYEYHLYPVSVSDGAVKADVEHAITVSDADYGSQFEPVTSLPEQFKTVEGSFQVYGEGERTMITVIVNISPSGYAYNIKGTSLTVTPKEETQGQDQQGQDQQGQDQQSQDQQGEDQQGQDQKGQDQQGEDQQGQDQKGQDQYGLDTQGQEQQVQHTHSFGDTWKYDATYHWKECTDTTCAEKAQLAAHTWNEGIVTAAATTETEGVKTYTCTICGATKNEAIEKLSAEEEDDPEDEEEDLPAVGTKAADSSGTASYKVTSTEDGDVEVQYVATKKKKKKVSIPASVTLEDGTEAKVTSVAKGAFKNNKTVTTVTIGSNIETVESGAFQGAKNLKTVTIGKNVKSIGSNAFKNCTSLTTVTFKGSLVESIGSSAFQGDTKLRTISIGKNVATIGSSAFSGCSSLTNVTISSTKLKSVGKNAFKGIRDTATVKVPKAKYSAYKKLLNKSGLPSKSNIKKS